MFGGFPSENMIQASEISLAQATETKPLYSADLGVFVTPVFSSMFSAASASQAAYGLALLLFSAIAFTWFRQKSPSKYSFPPGPRGLPLLGNILDVPSMPTWGAYRKWSDVYDSPIIHLKLLGQNLVILNTFKVTIDLLEKRSAIYSDRPVSIMFSELCGFSWPFVTMRYNQTWRLHRKLFHSQCQSAVAKRFRPVEQAGAHQFLRQLLEQPKEFMGHARLLAGAQIADIAYGIKVKSHNDPYIKLAEDAMSCVRAVLSAATYMVDFFPLLKYVPAWFPGATFQRQAKAWRTPVLNMPKIPFAEYKKRVANGEKPDCVATSMLDLLQSDNEKELTFSEDDIKQVLGTMYAAGSDTTVSAIQSFILAMVLNPGVLARAQEEIDKVCVDRLPEFDDWDALPYVEAIMREALRWNPVTPEALMHATTEDDVYEGYFIPKGSMVLPNSWAILHEEGDYPEPFSFNPDRFIKDGALDPTVLNPELAVFGYGRRICPGRFIARDSMWITIACTLAAFDIQPVKDANGNPSIPPAEYNWGFLCHPKPFQCEIRPRSERHASLVRSTLCE